ncbi:polymorphic toxin-type HINT domain-containing protein [Streptomyces sp. NPDC057494]|uniref:polymorphic toxin-type HINT domain-containing protein n=1 Tax=Streptomyces sp. NPDC057494 TaxID=3346148 RepID=UPI0036A31FD9
MPLTLALSVPLGLTPVAVAEGKGGLGRLELPEQRASKVTAVTGQGAKKARERVAKELSENTAQVLRARAERQRSAWPKAGTTGLTLAAGKATATPGGLPVTVTPVNDKHGLTAGTDATVTVLDQKAADQLGINGVILTAGAEHAGTADVSVDYSTIASAVGGDWAGRLRLVRLPACSLNTPHKAECRTQTPLASHNNVKDQTVSAKVSLAEAAEGPSPQMATAASGMTVLALTASGAGQSAKGTGDYSATPLSSSSSWSAGGSSGAFGWSYTLSTPPAAAGPAPTLVLSYDSGSIDGRTATTNNQGASVGEGFSLSESYIERSYGSCDDDGQTDIFDRCWKYDNARLVLNGSSSRLVKTATAGVWRLENDDASKVTRSTGAENGDDDGEYWTVVTGDGTKYVFGLDKLDGATTQRTNSVWTVPVFGDDSGEPGYDKGTAFAGRSLTQAWRWNLDYVEDTKGNAATYWYAKDTNYYKKNKASKADGEYIRGGHPTEIKYGLRKGALFTDAADAKVTFRYAERCTATDCSSLTKETAVNWPDVPFDTLCTKDSTDCLSVSPAFFTRKRLIGVDTFSWNTTTSTHDAVDSWDFTQEYLDGGDIGDSSDQVLALKSIKRTGKAGTTLALDPVTFTYQMRSNRVDGTDDILPMTRPRISTITSETGAITTVTLSAPECVRSQVLGAAQDTNTRNCYPQYWNINGAATASVDWFHKYRVLAVTESDPAGQNEAVENEYVYSGAAWHYNDDPFTPKDERTWSDWRGYRQVTVYKGAIGPSLPRSKTVSIYMQGMDGDKNQDGTTKSVSVAGLTQPFAVSALTDSDEFSGMLREQVTYDGTTPISLSAHQPWSQETARQSGVPDAADHVARYTRTMLTTSYRYLTASSTWQRRSTTTTFDGYGMPSSVSDSGDYSKSGDETCTRTWYARNDAAGLSSLPSRTQTVGRACSVAEADLVLPANSATRGDVLSDSAVAYDDAAWSTTMSPTKGLATWTGRANKYGADRAATWQKVTSTEYDDFGRPTKTVNVDGKATTTAYTPALAGPLTKTTSTNAASHVNYTYVDPRRGLPVRTYDANLKKTELAYDAMGRLTDVWLPNRIRGTQSPNSTYAYGLSNTHQSWVSSSTLKADGETYNTSYAIYDALLRPLQTQSPTPQGGRLLTDTRYDSRGLVYETYADIFDPLSAPNGTYTRAKYGEAPTQTKTVFDGAARLTSSSLLIFGVPQWTTSTTYTGDSTASTALAGGSATRTLTDARGRTIETREYAGANPTDSQYGGDLGTSYTSTKLSYTLDDKQTSITGPDGSQWGYSYDLLGRQITATDPDKGTSTSEYNSLDQVIKTTDARGKSILNSYDALGRPTDTWSEVASDATLLSNRTYDTVLKGKPATSTRYIGGKTGQTYTNAVTAYDALSRPTATELRLPKTDPLVATGTPEILKYTSSYRIDGTLANAAEPALGGLPAETIDYGYGSLGQLTSIKGSAGYLQNVDYSALGQIQQLTLGVGGTGSKNVYVTNTYQEGTGRLTESHVTDQTHPYMLQDLTYSFDQAGNVTSIADPTTLGGTSKGETQCFAYDGYRRLTDAWTPQSQKCADARDANTLSGPAPYWTSYTYNAAGQRETEAEHATTGTKTTRYCYDPAQPKHALRFTTERAQCGTADPAKDKVYGYDTTGNTTKRPGSTGQQDLAWSAEGRLDKVTESSKSTGYLYDADGQLLIRDTEGGERVLYAGATELHLKTDKTVWAQRTYGAGALSVAVRSNETGTNKLQFLAGDHHGTQSLAITADSAQSITKRFMSPFGTDRGGAVGTWPTDKGFLGKTADETTGLTHIGARQYDPLIGQFISVDPLLSTDQHQSLNGYSYANQHPTTSSDPTGLREPCGAYGNSCTPSGIELSGTVPGDVQKPSEGGKTDGGTVTAGAGETSGTASSGKTHGANDSDDCGFFTTCGWSNGWDATVDFLKENKEVVTFVTEVVVGGVCAASAVGAGFATGGAGFAAVAGCGAIAGAAASAVNNALTDGADHSITGQLSDIANGAIWGAATSVVGGAVMEGAVKLVGKAAGKIKLPPCNHSFLPDTQVLMADGSRKEIEDVEVGDVVVATDTETGENSEKRVLETIRTEDDKDFTRITVATDDGLSSIISTDTHPFWVPELHEWVDAGDLSVGQWLRTSAGSDVQITALSWFTKRQRTHDLTIEDIHTYYVLTGATPVLVHNCGGDLFRSDTRDPSEIFQNGFKALGDNMDLPEHVAGVSGTYTPPSGFVSTTTSETHAISRGGNVYTIRGATGRDVNKEIPDNPLSHEREIAVPHEVDTSCIVGCRLRDGTWVPNPNFKG